MRLERAGGIAAARRVLGHQADQDLASPLLDAALLDRLDGDRGARCVVDLDLDAEVPLGWALAAGQHRLANLADHEPLVRPQGDPAGRRRRPTDDAAFVKHRSEQASQRRTEWTNRLTGETRSVPVGIDPGWDYNPGAAHVRRAQRGLIAKLESRQLEIGRAVVRHNLGTGDFRRFVRGEATARGGEERAVALIGAARSRTLGFQDRVRAVRLSSESVETHPRYAGFATEDWRRVQRILEQGEWLARGARQRLLWRDEAGKPWTAVVKLTRNGEVYLQSYRRAQLDEVMRWWDG